MSVEVRAGRLEDAAAITAVHCSEVAVWRRGGKGEPAPYEALSLYDRWLHGGPWMSVETCAVHLNRWLRAGFLLLVAERDGEVVGEAEFVVEREPAPYGPSLHLALLIVHASHRRQGVARALVEAGARLASNLGCAALTTQPEPSAEPFYASVGFSPWLWLREWQAPAQPLPLPVEPDPLPLAPYPTDAGLVQRVGRYQCGRQAWEELPFDLALPEHQALPWGRWRLASPGGETAWLGLKAQALEPSQADGMVWARPQADLASLVETLQALAARLGFGYVDLLLEEPEGHDLAAARGFAHQTDVTLWRREVS
jgi:GNAT superfamily N-acetyltransferase